MTAEWPERLAQLVDEHHRRTEARRTLRTQLAAARLAGLAQRHSAREARALPQDTPSRPEPSQRAERPPSTQDHQP